VGGVVVFLPQILVLFFFIALLEDCGYMARAAFLMDRLLSRCGLSGRSFIPMLSSFACAIPGIMGARVIEDPRDRLATVLVAPLMSCSARLPVYMLLTSTFVPERDLVPGVLGLRATVLFAMHVLGVVVAIPVALLLKRTLLKGKAPAFVMELPTYKAPAWRMVLHRMTERGWEFLRRAGTTIFAVSVVIWALTYYPRPASIGREIAADFAPRIDAAARGGDAEAAGSAEAERDAAIAGAYIRQSWLGRMGHLIEPAVRPLGWDWRIGMAVIASFPAREVVVATLGIIYDLGSGADEESEPLKEKLRGATHPDGSPVFTLPAALSVMVFFALCLQCAATIAVLRRETNSWRWPLFAFGYMTALAYAGALATFQLARVLLA
jgi:ferrous iron transport protein B